MKIYIDDDFRCHATNPGNDFREFEVSFFDGKCLAFIEGYRFIPTGESCISEDGAVFTGETIVPWKPYDELDQAQRQHERELAEAARILLGEVSV